MIGRDAGGREGGDEGGAIKEAASGEITRGTHLTAVYPALLSFFCNFHSFHFPLFIGKNIPYGYLIVTILLKGCVF